MLSAGRHPANLLVLSRLPVYFPAAGRAVLVAGLSHQGIRSDGSRFGCADVFAAVADAALFTSVLGDGLVVSIPFSNRGKKPNSF